MCGWQRTRQLLDIAYVPSAWADLSALVAEEDLNEFELEVAKNPERWPLIRGTGGVRKARVPMPGTGKSGGARVLYVHDGRRSKLWVVTAYDKSKKASLTGAEKRTIKGLVKQLLS